RAYEKWLSRGRPVGTEMQEWLEAEAELRAEFRLVASGRAERAAKQGQLPAPGRAKHAAEQERFVAAPLSLFFDLSEFTYDDIADIISLLSDLSGRGGGGGLVIEKTALLGRSFPPLPEGV